jgi:dipeptidyl aminopeptidase/acylaminoacyl peptidase
MTATGHTTTEITYLSEGYDVTAVLYEPTDAGSPAAGIVLCPGRIRDIEGLSFLSRELADDGFVVLATRYRGMELNGDDADAVAALDYLSALPHIDTSRLGIVGHSRGGVCALRVAAKDTRIRTSVALQPPVDLASIVRATKYLSTQRYQALTSQLGGTPDDNPAQYAALSSLSYAPQIHIPVLIIAGSADLHSPADHCQHMYDALKTSGNDDVQLVTLDVGHFFERMYYGYEFEQVANHVVGWLRDKLSPAAIAADIRHQPTTTEPTKA